MQSPKKKKNQQDDEAHLRQKRRAEALRANLKRRKTQSRQRIKKTDSE